MDKFKVYQPKGSLCANCANPSTECARLPFSTMPVLKIYPDGVVAVKCSKFKALSKAAATL